MTMAMMPPIIAQPAPRATMTTVADYSDEQARGLIRNAIDETLIVEAAAGPPSSTA